MNFSLADLFTQYRANVQESVKATFCAVLVGLFIGIVQLSENTIDTGEVSIGRVKCAAASFVMAHSGCAGWDVCILAVVLRISLPS